MDLPRTFEGAASDLLRETYDTKWRFLARTKRKSSGSAPSPGRGRGQLAVDLSSDVIAELEA